LAVLLISGLALAFPLATAQSAVVVAIPKGAGSASGAPGYEPGTITVVVGINNTVTWTNNDTAPHTVTPVLEPTGGGWSGGSGDLPVNMSYSFTFKVPGNYSYTCAYHSWMNGVVVVEAASSPTPTPEFPAASLALIFFAVMAVVMLAAPRLRPNRMSLPAP
jgi:plastocyanin